MSRTYCTNDYESLSEVFFKRLVNNKLGKGSYTIKDAIDELTVFVNGFKKEEKQHNYWVSFKPFENPKNTPERWANSLHFASIEKPEESIYVRGMETQQKQFIAMEKAILRYLDTTSMNDKEKNKIIKKIETRKVKIF